MKKLIACVPGILLAGPVLAGAGTILSFDCREVLPVGGTERIVYSPAWETNAPGAEAVVSVNGVVVTRATEAGTYEWTPDPNGGIDVLTHVVQVGGVPVGETLKARYSRSTWERAADAGASVEVESQVRADDPTVIDIRYRVNAAYDKVKVRVLAFKDGTRSFANVVRPETFVADVDGHATAGNVGDAVAANAWHALSWKVAGDWAVELAKVKVEILAKNTGDGLWAFRTMKIPATPGHPALVVSKAAIPSDRTINALYWLYADGDPAVTVSDGSVRVNGTTVANGASLSNATAANRHIAQKMGYRLLEGAELAYVSDLSRTTYSGSYFCRTADE